MQEHHPTQPHWYLYYLGTEPEKQGTGIGAAVMRPVLDLCDSHRLPVNLEASSPRNRALYQRHGFDEWEPWPCPRTDPRCTRCGGSRSERQAGPRRDAAVPGGHARSVRLPVPPRSLPPMAAPGPTHHCAAALRWSQAVPAMTSSTLPIPTSTDVRDLEQASSPDDAEAKTLETCDVCPHARADHDAIAARFCSATGGGAITRGCVCRS